MEELIKLFMPRRIKEGLHQIIRRYFVNFRIDLMPTVDSAVILAGTTRGGTTWAGEVINYKADHRYMFEPFHPRRVDYWQKNKRYDYYSGECPDAQFAKGLHYILSGKIRDRWVDQYSTKLVYSKKMVKTVYANLILKGIQTHYPQIPIILLLRHPCAVAASQMKILKSEYVLDDMQRVLSDANLQADYVSFAMPEYEKLKTNFEKYIFFWCVQTYVPLRQFRADEVCLAFYEDLCEKPEAEIKRIHAYLKRDYDDEVFAKMKKPSNSCWGKDHAVATGGDLVNNWRKDVSDEQLERAVEILKIFGLDKIYDRGSMPNRDAAIEIMGYSKLQEIEKV